MELIDYIEIIAENMKKSSSVELLEKDLKLGDLTITTIIYLETIFKMNGDVNVTNIAKALNYKKSSVTTMIKKLEKQGYILKKYSGIDKRSFTIELSEKSLELKKYHNCRKKLFALKIESILNDDELNNLKKIMSKVVNNL